MPIRSPRRSPRRPVPAAAPLLALAGLLAFLPAYNMVGWFAHGLSGDGRKVQVKAQYTGLANQKIAVLVAADEYIQGRYPEAVLAVTRAVSSRIAANVPDTTLVPPKDALEFQKNNPYWTTVPYDQLIDKLEVDRLIVIDLIEYRTHDPGNAWVWQGMITGEVSVMEAGSEDPDNPTFSSTVRAQYPEKGELGLVNSSDETVQLGMLVPFARDAAGLFFDHEVIRD